jgi:hypothetical protein
LVELLAIESKSQTAHGFMAKNSCNLQASKQASKASKASKQALEKLLLLLLLLVDSWWWFFFRFCVVEEKLCEARRAPVLCTSSIAVLSNLNSSRFGAQTQLST